MFKWPSQRSVHVHPSLSCPYLVAGHLSVAIYFHYHCSGIAIITFGTAGLIYLHFLLCTGLPVVIVSCWCPVLCLGAKRWQDSTTNPMLLQTRPSYSSCNKDSSQCSRNCGQFCSLPLKWWCLWAKVLLALALSIYLTASIPICAF